MKNLLVLLFIFFSFSCFAEESFDYWNYELQGEFKKEVYREDYSWTWEFLIYNNKIVMFCSGDTPDGMLEPFPNGEFTLKTYKGSKIKIKAENGIIKNFELLGNIDNFKKNENKIEENDYCVIAYNKAAFDEVYNKSSNFKYLKIKNFDYDYKTNNRLEESLVTGFLLYEKDNKYITVNVYYDEIGKNSNEKQYYSLTNNELKEVKKSEKYDVLIDNCVLKYYNSEKFSINSIDN